MSSARAGVTGDEYFIEAMRAHRAVRQIVERRGRP
jgi:hypothetical protein